MPLAYSDQCHWGTLVWDISVPWEHLSPCHWGTLVPWGQFGAIWDSATGGPCERAGTNGTVWCHWDTLVCALGDLLCHEDTPVPLGHTGATQTPLCHGDTLVPQEYPSACGTTQYHGGTLLPLCHSCATLPPQRRRNIPMPWGCCSAKRTPRCHRDSTVSGTGTPLCHLRRHHQCHTGWHHLSPRALPPWAPHPARHHLLLQVRGGSAGGGDPRGHSAAPCPDLPCALCPLPGPTT